MENNKRINGLDLLRFFSICLMIMGHIGFGELFSKYIHSFHMPIWFFISGYFCNPNKSLILEMKKRCCSLLIPYLFFGLIYTLVYNITTTDHWIGLLYPNHDYIPYNASLWFLPSLFFADIMCFSLIKYLKKPYAYICIITISLIGSLSLAKIPFAVDSSLVGMGFFLLGTVIKNDIPRLLNINIYITIILFFVGSILTLINEDVNLRANNYSNIMLFWVSSITLIIAFINIFVSIDKYIDFQVLRNIGRYSVIYVCINQVLINIIAPSFKFVDNMVLLIAFKFIELIIIITVCYIFDKLIRKTRLKILLGYF